MNKSLSLIVQSICLAVFAFVIYAGYCGYNNGLNTADFMSGITAAVQGNYECLIGLVIISLQLCLMRWDKGVFNIGLCVLSFLLMTELVYIILGPKIALTAPLQNLLTAEGMPNVLSSFSSLYWLIPVLWMLTLTRAGAQVRIFCTALLSYLAWVILTPLFSEVVEYWKNFGKDVMPQVLDLFRNAPWMESATIGAFFVLYALFISLMEAIFTASKAKK